LIAVVAARRDRTLTPAAVSHTVEKTSVMLRRSTQTATFCYFRKSTPYISFTARQEPIRRTGHAGATRPRRVAPGLESPQLRHADDAATRLVLTGAAVTTSIINVTTHNGGGVVD
jgi:hypothetical protein